MMDTHQILVLFAHTSIVKIITCIDLDAHGIAFVYLNYPWPLLLDRFRYCTSNFYSIFYLF